MSVDAVIKRHLGAGIEKAVQKEIKSQYGGSMPIGSAVCVPTGAAVPRYLISTPNLNFLIGSRRDCELRDSLQLSELCTADGMPIVWIGRLLGAPFKERVAGADMFDALQGTHAKRLSVFFFGGAWGVAAAAGRSVNDRRSLECVGSMYPGYCSVDELSKILSASQLSPVEHAVLMIGAYELMNCLEIPYRVAINEAVELAKSFGGTDGHKYVNGVLDKCAAELRPNEARPRP